MGVFRRILRLYSIQIFASIAVALAIYFPGLDLILGLVFFLVVGAEAALHRGKSSVSTLIVILIWQLPGLLLSLMSIIPAEMWGSANYGFFVLQFCYTPVVPLLSYLPGYILQGKPVYYYILLSAPIWLGFYYYLVFFIGDRLGGRLGQIKSQRT